MDNIIYFVGNKFCSLLNSFGGSILSNKVGCGWDNYDKGLYVLIFLQFFYLVEVSFSLAVKKISVVTQKKLSENQIVILQSFISSSRSFHFLIVTHTNLPV